MKHHFHLRLQSFGCHWSRFAQTLLLGRGREGDRNLENGRGRDKNLEAKDLFLEPILTAIIF